MAFETYQQHPNFCRVTSASVALETLTAFASRLREELIETKIEHVDSWEPTHRLPVVVPTSASSNSRSSFPGEC